MNPLILVADLADPDLYATGNPDAAWRSLRNAAPVYWNAEREGPGFWALTRYADVVDAYRDPILFSSARGNVLNAHHGAEDPAAGKMLSMMDPPRHAKVRGLINRAFSPAAVAQLRPLLIREIRRLVRTAAASESVDFTHDVAAPIPLMATCAVMGIPSSDWGYVLDVTRRAFNPDERAYADESGLTGRSSLAHTELLVYCSSLLEEKRKTTGGDVISRLAQGRIDGQPLSDEEIVLTCNNLIAGGNETTRFAASMGVLALAERPSVWARLKAAPELVPLAVEEILRWVSPAMHVARTLTRDVELHGIALHAGDTVTLWNASANRDERVFANADDIEITRQPNRHVALGLGGHFCIGAAMARLELALILQALITDVSRIRVIPPVTRLRSTLIRGVTQLHVRLYPA